MKRSTRLRNAAVTALVGLLAQAYFGGFSG